MTRILSYNILMGGTNRINQLTKIIQSVHPDIVGLVEATDPHVVKELAERLEMRYVMSGNTEPHRDLQVALLSRFPITRTQVHKSPGILTKSFLEATVEEPDGQHLTVFVVHLSSDFNRGRGGGYIRKREVQEILRIVAARQGTAHLLMGDFNALAPGDPFEAHKLLRYMVKLDRHRKQKIFDGNPHLDGVVPAYLHFLHPLLRVISRHKLLCILFDAAASRYISRESIALLYKAGYVDCFRHIHSQSAGFTCPASSPSGRIDYIFASPELASHLSHADVVTEGNGVCGDEASDHLAVVADY